MELSEDITIPAPMAKVYDSLNNVTILSACTPGCEELVEHSDAELEVPVVLKIGLVKAKFSGQLAWDTTNAPDKFSLAGAGDGGIAGFAKGGADVELIADGKNTLLRYTANAETGGKIAQLGSRLVTSTARKLSKAFLKILKKLCAVRCLQMAIQPPPPNSIVAA